MVKEISIKPGVNFSNRYKYLHRKRKIKSNISDLSLVQNIEDNLRLLIITAINEYIGLS